ncbi:BspA family leucine-rich repeat surface protein [Campylobacter sp.]|uniref:BspA family leucine-rich repeat surface protein n=1 Tax=Campylobacter sp. TaxID=205 RepID=UPI002A81E563|nr:BspA family leucine-rich repeat surface protein [Campylobacter sp.]MDY4803375.1 BspA family leucine-rich repeat surface protein [Campylobacter sp.]
MSKYTPKTFQELKWLVDDESVYLGDIDTSLITDMSRMFIEVSREDFCGIESWDVSNVVNMYAMFSGQKDFYADLSSWDVSKVENMDSMFYGCKKFNGQIPKGWDLKADSSYAFLSFRSMLKKYKN